MPTAAHANGEHLATDRAREPATAEETGYCWENRLLTHLPRSALQVAVIVGAPLVALYIAAQWLLGYGIHREGVLLCGIVAYSFAVDLHLSDVHDPRSTGAPGPSYLEHTRQAIRRSRVTASLGLAGAIGVIQVLTHQAGESWLAPWTRIGPNTSVIPVLLLVGWLMGRFAYLSLMGVGNWADVPRPPLDLLDLEPAYRAGRLGVRTSLVWIVAVAISGLFFVEDDLAVVVTVVAVGIAVGVAALLIPVHGIVREIRAAKRAELARIRAELSGLRDAALSGTGTSPGRLADLLAYESRVQALSEWPLDVPTLRRFALYLMIPLASMVGGALVERVVDALLPS